MGKLEKAIDDEKDVNESWKKVYRATNNDQKSGYNPSTTN